MVRIKGSKKGREEGREGGKGESHHCAGLREQENGSRVIRLVQLFIILPPLLPPPCVCVKLFTEW